MPELPEVEMARRGLAEWLGGGTVVKAAATDAKIGRFNGKITSIERRGKRLRIAAEGPKGEVLLFSHLGMTGRWVTRPSTEPKLRWERARLDVVRRGKASTVRYVDVRRFGHLAVATKDIAAWTKLGPDPLIEGIDVKRLAERLGRRPKLSIKEALMDQAILAGVGNIMATEALWRAKIDPRRSAAKVSAKEVATIAKGIHWTIDRTLAIAAKDAEVTYVQDAHAENPFKVYGRKGEPCPRCRAVLVRIELGGRTTTFCEACQR